MSSALEQIVERGHNFVERYGERDSTINHPLSVIEGHRPGSTRNDGTYLDIVTSIAMTEEDHPSRRWMDEPLVAWNGSVDEPNFEKVLNPIMNMSECSPMAIARLAENIMNSNVPCTPEIEDGMLDRIGAVIFAGATPRMLAESLQGDDLGFIIKDEANVAVHAVSARLFYSMLAEKKLFIFDIHDIAHHALQIQLWPEFFTELGAMSYEAYESDDEPTRRVLIARHVSTLVVDAVFEDSVIARGDELHSFGCLNWLSPRDTPVAGPEFIANPSWEYQQLVRRWHALYGVKDLYRTQRQASERLGMELNWVERLGYSADERFRQISEQAISAPFAEHAVDAAYDFSVQAPGSPTELIANATSLLEDLGLWRQGEH